MAKQSGIHQLRGKVGEHSYYRQSGVEAGLMRGINPAMSGRVKTGDEFANTRLNNAEFRSAAELASAMGGIIQPKFRPMILPFSQSRLTKNYLSLIKETEGEWGQRHAVAAQAQAIADYLNDLAKTKFSDLFKDINPVVISSGETEANVQVGFTQDQSNVLAGLGINGVVFKLSPVRLNIGEYSSDLGRNRITSSALGTPEDVDIEVEAGNESTSTLSLEPVRLDVPGYVTIYYGILIAMPYRTVGSVKYTLQEHCTFKCVPVTYAV